MSMAYYEYKRVRDQLIKSGHLDEYGNPSCPEVHGAVMDNGYDGNLWTLTSEHIDSLEASNTALREELAALKAYNSELARAGEFIDHPMVSQLSEKWVDDFKSSLAKTPAQSLAKVRADAIRDAATALCNFRGLMNTVDQDELNEHANKIEAGL